MSSATGSRVRTFRRRLPAVAGMALLIAGCARYHPDPLPADPGLIGDWRTAARRAGLVDEQPPLTPATLVELAIRLNPGLAVDRAREAEARAGLRASRLLDDPQITAAFDHPTSNQPGLTNAFSLGLAYDLRFFLTWPARIAAARARARQAELERLWREWQVAQQARILAVRHEAESRKLALLTSLKELYLERARDTLKALAEGDVTIDVAGVDQAALLDVDSRLRSLERAHVDTTQAIKGLLGLAPDAALPAVVTGPPPDPPGPEAVASAVRALADVRPDLLALRHGYAAQEAAVRKAVLEQFPSIAVGPTVARDTSDVRTWGVGVSLTLPLFNANRGAIRIERATHARLKAEYRQRLQSTVTEIGRLARQARIVASQLADLRASITALESIVAHARTSYLSRDINTLAFTTMQRTLIDKRIELVDLETAQWELVIALETLLGRAPLVDAAGKMTEAVGGGEGTEAHGVKED